jgi:hypothetical protein
VALAGPLSDAEDALHPELPLRRMIASRVTALMAFARSERRLDATRPAEGSTLPTTARSPRLVRSPRATDEVVEMARRYWPQVDPNDDEFNGARVTERSTAEDLRVSTAAVLAPGIAEQSGKVQHVGVTHSKPRKHHLASVHVFASAASGGFPANNDSRSVVSYQQPHANRNHAGQQRPAHAVVIPAKLTDPAKNMLDLPGQQVARRNSTRRRHPAHDRIVLPQHLRPSVRMRVAAIVRCMCRN